MDDKPFWYNEFKDQTTLHPLGLAVLLACGLLTIVLPRRHAVWPMLVVACFVAPAQRIVVFNLDFTLLRVMVIFGWLRVLSRKEWCALTLRSIDWAILAWAVSGVVMHMMQRATLDALINRLGYAYDAAGMYFVFRCLIRDWRDARTVIGGLAVISIPVAIAFVIENRTGRNAFAFFGGVPEITVIRDGRLRCQGAFAHPILAGCFWAAIIPMVAAGWWTAGRHRLLAIVGTVTSLIIVTCSSSSTPVGALINGAIAALLFPVRRHMRLIRLGAVLILVALHLVMKAPVWHLIARVQFVGGSTSWHRFYVIDQAINHFDKWWLLGLPGGVYIGFEDCTNQYVAEGLKAGILTLWLFFVLLVLAFKGIGRMWRAAEGNTPRIALAWAIGVSLWVHCVSFIGVSYFGQIIVVWYLQLAFIGSLASKPQSAFAQAVRSVWPRWRGGAAPLPQ